MSILNSLSVNDLIKSAKYYDTMQGIVLDLSRLRIDNIDSTRRETSGILSQSPLFKAYRSINNLLATYSARYNIYVNNGAAGYLVKKTSSNSDLNAIVDPIDRDKMLADINNRNGLTGRRNLWGVSSVPLEFVNTLSDIQKLMPFEETLENSIKIASVYQIPPELIPRKDQTTFNNKSEAERSVWENGLMSMVDTATANFSKALCLDIAGYSIQADYSTVSSLVIGEDAKQITLEKKITNYGALYEKGIIKYNDYLKSIGEPEVIGGDKYIYEMSKTPYAVKLGVGGTQALQMILSDPNIDATTKYNTLIVVFGLTESEAKLIANI